MEYEDRLRVATPEGITIDVTLAGLGSRMAAAIIDTAIQGLVLIAASVILTMIASGLEISGVGAPTTAEVVIGIASLILPIVGFFLYGILFETLWNGRTPGKRLVGIRVIQATGRPIGFRASAIRNLARLVDGLPVLYLAGAVTILVNQRNQRLGDILAGSVVVRDRIATQEVPMPPVSEEERASLELWDVGGVTYDEFATVRHFLARRHTLDPEARAQLASDLERRLRTKVRGAPSGQSPEGFLERLAAAKAAKQ